MSFLPPRPPDLDRPEAPAPTPSHPQPQPHPHPQPQPRATRGRQTNKHAVWGLILAACGLALLFLTAGFAAPVSLPACIAGWILGVKAKRRVDRGEPVGDRPLAVAAQVTGIVGVVLSVLTLAFWVFVITQVDWSLGLDIDPPFQDPDPGGQID